jgi:pyrroline-5-carboxylate reductase
MKITVVGSGRIGKILAAAMSGENEVVMYDADRENAERVAGTLNLKALATMTEAAADAIVLAVPDKAVASCVAELAATGQAWNIFSVATNLSREMLAGLANREVRCLNVKIIGHAGEMSRGSRPVLVIDQGEAKLVELAQQVFAAVGVLTVGEADQVQRINNVATTEALRAAVAVEGALRTEGITDPAVIRGALSQVAPGVMRAYAENDLGPFAREIVAKLRRNGQEDAT